MLPCLNRIRIAACLLAASVSAGVLPAAASDMSGVWTGALVRNGQRWSVRMTAWSSAAATRVCFDFPDYGLYYRCSTDVNGSDGAVSIRYTSGSDTVVFAGKLEGGRYVGTWKGLGVDAEFQLARGGDAPEPLVEENVRFTNGDVELSGTLIRPRARGRYAAMVWTHGSGRQRRTEDFYRDRGYLLAEHGMAALIYDKRGTGESGGDPDSTLDELAGDAVAAVQYLQSRGDIDRDAVGIGGFSQGGYVAPLAASRYGRIAFVVVGAAPGVTPAEQNDFAARTALARRSVAPAEIEQAMALRRRVLRAQETGADLEAVNAALRAARDTPWFRLADLPERAQQYGRRGVSVLEFDPATAWTRIDVPVLAVWGEQDALVPAERSRQRIASWLRAAHDADVTLRRFPGAGHGLSLDGQPGVWDWPRLAPGFHDQLVEWVTMRAGAAQRAHSTR